MKMTVLAMFEEICSLFRNPSVGKCLKFFIFLPYGFDYLEFLTNARRGAMRSKTQWVFYRDLDDVMDHKKSNSGKSLGTLRLKGSSWLC